MLYVASPLSDPAKVVREDRAYQVGAFAAFYTKRGYILYAPIAAWYHLAKEHDLPKGFDFWRRHDFQILRLCDGLWVLMLEGWDESVGVTAEIELAKTLHIPIRYFNGENFAEEAMQGYALGEV